MTKQDKILEEAFFDKFNQGEGYERFYEQDYEKILSLMELKIHPEKGETLVDMGCATGAFARRISERFPGLNVLGLDISPGCILRAQELCPQIRFGVADVENSGLATGSVDIICFFGLLHHFPDFTKVLKEAFRVLKPGGRVFSFDPHHHNPFFWLYRSKNSPLYSPIGVTANERLLTSGELRNEFAKAGFRCDSKVFSGIRFAYLESRFARKFLWAYNFLDRLLGASPLGSKIGAWIIGWGVKDAPVAL